MAANSPFHAVARELILSRGLLIAHDDVPVTMPFFKLVDLTAEAMAKAGGNAAQPIASFAEAARTAFCDMHIASGALNGVVSLLESFETNEAQQAADLARLVSGRLEEIANILDAACMQFDKEAKGAI